jgi:hypothetical protein
MMSVCALAMVAVIQSAQPKLSGPLREWIAHNVCNAANDTGTDPALLGAYMLTENRAIDLWAIVPAHCGNDHSLFQINSCYARARADFRRVHHPYYGAKVAAEILHENLTTFGWSWQAFAAYWNPAEARRGTQAAIRYYAQYHANAQWVERALATARSLARAAPQDKQNAFSFQSGEKPRIRFTPATIGG